MSELPEVSEFVDLPAEIDTSRPHPARTYNYALGGKDHFAADREVMDKMLAVTPAIRTMARENRAFLGRRSGTWRPRRASGSSLTSAPGCHPPTTCTRSRRVEASDARVVYVDNDPMVLAHARALLTSSPEGRTAYIHADLRDPLAILNDPATFPPDVLDFSQPIALVLVAVLHFIPDEDKPGDIVATLLRRAAPGQLPSRVAQHRRNTTGPVGPVPPMRAYRDRGITFQLRDSDEFARPRVRRS